MRVFDYRIARRRHFPDHFADGSNRPLEELRRPSADPPGWVGRSLNRKHVRLDLCHRHIGPYSRHHGRLPCLYCVLEKDVSGIIRCGGEDAAAVLPDMVMLCTVYAAGDGS